MTDTQQCDPKDLTAFVGRQPIFDSDKNVFGYELLFRSDTNNANSAGQGDQVSTTLMNNSLSIIGLDTLTNGKKAFVNITRQLLLDGDYSVLPKETTVVELLEDITADPEVIAACESLKSAGYTLALDDLISTEGYEPLLEMADIIKVDFMDTSPAVRIKLARELAKHDAKLLAEKVETHEEFQQAIRLGYTYYQGYFFSKPQIINAKDISGTHQNYLQLLAEVNRPDTDFDKLEQVIKADLSLSTKLLRYLNSAAFGMRNEVTSLKQAMILLGIQPLRKWASLVTMSYIGQDSPDELMVSSLVRARFCEEVATPAGMGNRKFDLFMMGMLSTLDAILGRPIEELLAPMPLAPDIKATLVGEQTPLSDIHALSVACERVDRPEIENLVQRTGIDTQYVENSYRESLFWADEITRAA